MTDPDAHHHVLCGWRVASVLPLPDLPPWSGDDRAPDLTIGLGPIPERLADLVVDRPLLQVAADGSCRFAAPGVAVYLIDAAGRHVTIDPALDPAVPDVRVFLFGTVFGVLCHRRGLLPLHASCVRVGDGAVALAGQSGVGKSTLAAAFLRRGHAVLADDVTVVDALAPGGPRVLPAFPRLKLWRDAMERLRFPIDGLERSRRELEKYHLPVDDAFCARPLPLAAVFHLDPDMPRDGGLSRRLRGPEAVARVGRDIYRRAMMARLGLAERILPAAVRIIGVAGGTWLLAHGHEPGGLERGVDGVLERMKA